MLLIFFALASLFFNCPIWPMTRDERQSSIGSLSPVLTTLAIIRAKSNIPSYDTLSQNIAKYDRTETNKHLGFDPKIGLHRGCTRQGGIHTHTPIAVYCHSLGEDERAALYHPLLQETGYIVAFRFNDTDIGQNHDAKTAIFALHTVNENVNRLYGTSASRPPLALYGRSRGGAAAINVITILQDAKTSYPELDAMGITRDKRAELLRQIKNGYVILEVPLLSVPATINHMICRPFAWLLSPIAGLLPSSLNATLQTSGRCVAQPLASLAHRAALPLIYPNYRPEGMQPIDSLEKWKKENTPKTLVHIQTPDEIVGNQQDEKFKTLCDKLNIQVHTSRDTGHNGFKKQFELVLQNFVRQQNAHALFNGALIAAARANRTAERQSR